jgi:Kef-type K+ transport system membrane component KefB
MFAPHYHPLLVIALIAVLAPLVNELPLRLRVPSVVLEIVFGILVGPQVLGWVRADEAIEVLWKIGLCVLFLLAGIEIDLIRIRGKPLQLAVGGWVFSFALGNGAAFLLSMSGLVDAPLLVALALSTTAIGALLPILRDAGELSREFGILTLAAGAVGEFAPLLVLSLIPIGATRSVAGNALVVLVFTVVSVMTGLIALRVRPRKFLEILKRQLHQTGQLPVRLAVLLMAALAVFSIELGLEFLVGAFAAGLIVGIVARGEEAKPFHHKLDGLGFGFLVPIFFVVTGVKFDLNALIGNSTSLLCVPLFLAPFFLVRGLPVCLYRRELGGRDRLSLAFYSATALPVVVAVAQLGVAKGLMQPGIAAALVGASMISLLLFPQIAMALRMEVQKAQEPGPDQRDKMPEAVRQAT